jgi:hypothetical protein
MAGSMVTDDETTAYGRVTHAIHTSALRYSVKLIQLLNWLPFDEGAG